MNKYDKGFWYHESRKMELPNLGDWAVALVAIIGWLMLAGVLK